MGLGDHIAQRRRSKNAVSTNENVEYQADVHTDGGELDCTTEMC